MKINLLRISKAFPIKRMLSSILGSWFGRILLSNTIWPLRRLKGPTVRQWFRLPVRYLLMGAARVYHWLTVCRHPTKFTSSMITRNVLKYMIAESAATAFSALLQMALSPPKRPPVSARVAVGVLFRAWSISIHHINNYSSSNSSGNSVGCIVEV